MFKKILLIITVFVIFFAIVALFFLKGSVQKIEVISVSPLPNSQDASLFPTFSASFNRSVGLNEQKEIKIDISPATDFTTYWSSDNKTLFILPDKALVAKSSYTASLIIKDYSYSWTFITTSITTPSEEDLSNRQGQEDIFSAQAEKDFIDKYPWYNELPEPNDDYFIGFDTEKLEFFVDLYPKSSSPTPIPQQEEKLKKDVLDALQKLGVDTDKYKIVWASYPK